MKVEVRNLVSNPYRKIDKYPIDRDKVESLKTSIDETGFWDNILARPKPNHSIIAANSIFVQDEYGSEWDEGEAVVVGKEIKDDDERWDDDDNVLIKKFDGFTTYEQPVIEIAYGHHRLQAIKELGITEIDIPVKKIDDATMIKIMANENMENWRLNTQVINETVLVAKEYIEMLLDLSWDELCKNTQFNIFENQQSFSSAKEKGVGFRTIKKFLGKNWKEHIVRESLYAIKGFEDGTKIDREAAELFKVPRHSKVFMEEMRKKKIPKEKQKEYAEKTIKNIIKDVKEECKRKGHEVKDEDIEQEFAGHDIREKVYDIYVEEKKESKPELFKKSKIDECYEAVDVINALDRIKKLVKEIKEKKTSVPIKYHDKLNQMISNIIEDLKILRTIGVE